MTSLNPTSRCRQWLLTLACGALLSLQAAAEAPAPIDTYAIHDDGGLVYNPLYREATKTGQLAKYDTADFTAKQIKLGDALLVFKAPAKASAYDVIPIPYELTPGKSAMAGKAPAIAVEAVAFENKAQRMGRDLYDLALPGNLDLGVQYLGSITAHLTPGARHNLEPDLSDEPKHYPNFQRQPLVRSGVVEAGDLVWFKFRVTNTGNTVLDPEGMGGFVFFPELQRKDDNGEWTFWGNPYNLYVRPFDYLYPGESTDIWIHYADLFHKRPTDPTPQCFGMVPGEYKIIVRTRFRNYREANSDILNMWDGSDMTAWEMPITVAEEASQAPVQPGKTTFTNGGADDKLTRYIHTFQEFMTTFDMHLEPAATLDENGSGNKGSIKGTLYLQVAPWTDQVVVKLIGTDPMRIATVAVPIAIDTDTLSVKYDPDHPMNIVRDGKREPVIYTQSMADMRVNVQHSPFPEDFIEEQVDDMISCGINVWAVTMMPWLYDDINKPVSNYQGDAMKYFLELARKKGLNVEGWSAYPYDRATIQWIHNWLSDEKINVTDHPDGGHYISHDHPDLPRLHAPVWLYQFHRWGDLYNQLENGIVPIGTEDSRGWMRLDVNIRYPLHAEGEQAFREWAQEKYTTIEAANKAWGSEFASFEAVAPEQGQVANKYGHLWEWTDPKNPFHDWNAAVADVDIFRTEQRNKNYADTLALVRKEIPTASMLVRTEGGNVIVDGISPDNPSPHMRHIYYSQRRVGLIADVIQKAGYVKFHSDYTTIPYTPSELRELVPKAVEQGIIPCWLPQFENMRDIAVNELYGVDYQTHYNIDRPLKGTMMHVLTPAFTWFQAVYESGGTPGVLYSDIQCDGFVTETQRREMQLFKRKLDEALSTPEALASRSKGVQSPSQDWRKAVGGKKAYILD